MQVALVEVVDMAGLALAMQPLHMVLDTTSRCLEETLAGLAHQLPFGVVEEVQQWL